MNPLTMLGTIQRCWLFTYQTPVEEARPFLPAELEPVTHGDFAFWNVVFCRLHAMRPWPLPPLFGIGYWHVAYRLYARFCSTSVGPVEGLYFARSDANSRLVAVLGNVLTDYCFHTAGIRVDKVDHRWELRVASPDAPARATLHRSAPPGLPSYSAFASLDEAATFLKYKPVGLSISGPGRVNVVRIVRQEDTWRSRLVRIEAAEWAFFNGKTVRPEICYEVEPIAYQWNRGRVHTHKGCTSAR